ncbi:hypothetical protein FEM48_Zijuj06G0023600 [Ziziphus jujuba var. spinosa]|uniref:Kinesin motor domain-containing protein n=1 Tax=Ziziphus jujuba var. spinosa TaxID=714518 RepID=A0A978V6L3_ZIZJJ|nr:hypothetical protein FEM48_Zijuj06G0023600 [Ziziphus jujuba var. spinosa]
MTGDEPINEPINGNPQGSSNSQEEKIFVSVRLRPLNEKELARNEASDWECLNNNTIAFNCSQSDRVVVPSSYSFDKVFGCDCTTEQVYQEGAKDVILSVLRGINSTIFAYGQTSSGKTYTMTGITECAHKDTEFVLKFSAMEIYNEAVRDLLSSDSTQLRLLDDPEKGTVVEKLTETVLRDSNHLHELLSVCEVQRKVGETALNEASSRSHQILRLTIESSAREYGDSEKQSTLAATVNLVDLAGSERSSQALSAGARLKEGSHINRSLLTLGTVIRKLSKKNRHIPYRDSKLTRILHNSLGGNARTAIICTLSPARSHVEQSRNALFFASCAKEVTTNAKVNVVVSDKVLVKQLQRELAKLEAELRNLTSKSTTHDSATLLKEKELLIQQMDKEIKELTRQRDLAQSQVKTMLTPVVENRASRVDNNSSSGFDYFHLDTKARDVSKRIDRPRLSNSSNHQRQLSQNSEDNFLLDCSTPKFAGPDPCQGWEEVAQSVDEESEAICKEVRCIEKEDSRVDHKREALPHGEVPDSTYEAMKRKIQDMQRTIDCLINLYPQEQSPCYSEATMSSSTSLMLTRSKSCKAVVVSSPSSSNYFKEAEQYLETTPDGSGNGRAQGSLWKPSMLNNDSNIGILSRKDSPASVLSVSPHTRKISDFYITYGNELSGGDEGSGQRFSSANNGKLSRKESLETEMEMEYTESVNNLEDTFQEDCSGREGLRKKLFKSKFTAKFGKLSKKQSGTSIMSAPLERQVTEEDSSGDDTVSVLNSVSGRSRKSKPYYDVDSDNLDKKVSDRKLNRGKTKVASSEVQCSLKPKSNWPFEFEIRRREIIKLWNACNVPLVHRTYFFLLYKGDPSDAVYLEVEVRRLAVLKDTFAKEKNTKREKKDRKALTPASSLKELNREREMLSKKVHKKFSKKERERLYQEWGIRLDTKQRSLQLARCLWSDIQDLDHFKRSAGLIAKLVGFEEQNQAPKEIFAISFLPRPVNQKSFGWKDSMSTL